MSANDLLKNSMRKVDKLSLFFRNVPTWEGIHQLSMGQKKLSIKMVGLYILVTPLKVKHSSSPPLVMPLNFSNVHPIECYLRHVISCSRKKHVDKHHMNWSHDGKLKTKQYIVKN